jgi:hypothetical protein
MAEPLHGVLAEVARLPADGTPERTEWDRTIRQANELYPDWSICVGTARCRRETYARLSRQDAEETGRSKRDHEGKGK